MKQNLVSAIGGIVATVVATVPTGMVGGMPHHTEQVMPQHDWALFANAFHAGRGTADNSD